MHLPLTKTRWILLQQRQPSKCPVDHPWATRIHGDKASRIIFQRIVEIGNMAITLECGYTGCIESALLGDMKALEKCQALLKGCVLQLNGLCHERVADRWRLCE